AETALGGGLSAASDGRRRVRASRARRLLGPRWRRGLPRSRGRGTAALRGRPRGDRAPALDAARRRCRRTAGKPRSARCPGGDHIVVRGARRLPATDGLHVIRDLGGGLRLDDDKERIDVAEVHRFLSEGAYWAIGRPRETVERLVNEASRVVGLYDGEQQIGFCRAFTDGLALAYLADVYVLPEYRGRGLGEE